MIIYDRQQAMNVYNFIAILFKMEDDKPCIDKWYDPALPYAAPV